MDLTPDEIAQVLAAARQAKSGTHMPILFFGTASVHGPQLHVVDAKPWLNNIKTSSHDVKELYFQTIHALIGHMNPFQTPP